MLKLTKDPSHRGYYQDQDGNLYVFRFGGRPIKVDGYRDDKPREDVNVEEVNVKEETVIDHRKSASKSENQKFIDEAEKEFEERQNKINKMKPGDKHYDTEKNHLESKQRDLVSEINNTEDRNKNSYTSQELKDKYGTDDVDLINAGKAKEDRVSKKEESSTDSKSNLANRYKEATSVSDDWFTEEGRKLGMTDEEIGDAIYKKRGIALNSTDDNIKRIVAGKEREAWENKLRDIRERLQDPDTGVYDRDFYKEQEKGIQNEIERYANYEAEFIKRVNRDDEHFSVKYRDGEFTENFKAVGLDEAFMLQEEWSKYSPDVHIYDSNGKEVMYDSQRKRYTSPKYEENKIKERRTHYRNSLYGADRATLVSMVHNLGLNWNVERFTDQQLYRMLEKELKNNK